ncbi:MAG TPA: aminotransferase class IV, partial [Acidimicrobiales bacterium]|nr:aminotransferase class IV [Acidimicrobiales bacterium]
LAPPNEELILSSLDAVLEADDNQGLIRITRSSGLGSLSSSRGGGPGTLIVATQPAKQWPDSEAVHVCPWARNEHAALVGLKTTSYAENVLALKVAQEQNCSEALFLNTAGFLCEGTGSNIFVVIDDTLITPPLSSGCLAGITREIILELVDVVERDVHPTEFDLISEAFLSSSTRDVIPIARIDDLVLPNIPGLVTSEVITSFATFKATELDAK